jgi:ribosomal protein S12 methylthiotransferase accessory factor
MFMGTSVLKKYKEVDPKDTIHKIRSIIHEMGFLTVEKWYESSLDKCYSVFLRIDGTQYGTFGKGTTREFALASAYGEFMERVQNSILYLLDKSDSFDKHEGFYFAPDEKIFSVDDILQRDEAWLGALINKYSENNSPINESRESSKAAAAVRKKVWLERLLLFDERVFKNKGFENDLTNGSKDLLTIPFFNVCTNDICYVPYHLLDIIYGSNGTCAGNSSEEAIVQGLSEIIERYVNIKVIKEKITPPVIPDSYLEKYPRVSSIIKNIESKGPYKIIVKDCSLGENLPAVAAIFIDKSNQNYMIRFGVHPTFEIALERCLTETFQGRDLRQASVNHFHFSEANDYVDRDIMNICRSGEGDYPVEFFLEDYSYEFVPFKEQEWTNPKMVEELLNILIKKGYDVLIRDVSFLGFPSFKIIVPGFSEIYDLNLSQTNTEINIARVRNIMRRLHCASDDEIRSLVSYIKSRRHIVKENTLAWLLGVQVENLFAKVNSSTEFLSIVANYRLGNLGQAYSEMKVLIDENKLDNEYYRCVKDYICAKANLYTDEQIKYAIAVFYSKETVDTVLRHFGDTKNIFDNFYRKATCWECSGCEVSNVCSYKLTDKFLQAVKSKYKMGFIQQKDLVNLIRKIL